MSTSSEPAVHPFTPRVKSPAPGRRFSYPLPAYPGWVALYSVVDVEGTPQLQWHGIRPANRIPPEYGASEA